MNAPQDCFWIIWCPSGSTPPSYRHETYQSAAQEAERLARCSGNAEFYVMRAETMRKVENMQRIDFVHPGDHVPF